LRFISGIRLLPALTITQDSLEMFDRHRVAMALERGLRLHTFADEREHLLYAWISCPHHLELGLRALLELRLEHSRLRSWHTVQAVQSWKRGSACGRVLEPRGLWGVQACMTIAFCPEASHWVAAASRFLPQGEQRVRVRRLGHGAE
jgi:hypothetical protein